jgi:hypothetical protein
VGRGEAAAPGTGAAAPSRAHLARRTHRQIRVGLRRWLVLIVGGVVAVTVAITPVILPDLVRRLAVAHIHATTGRPVGITAVDVQLLGGRLTLRGLRVTERDRVTPFASAQRIDLRVRLPWLVLGRVWLRELTLIEPAVHVVRLPSGELNIAELIGASGGPRDPLDITVDRFSLQRGTVTLEDRTVPEPRIWTSEQIAIEARNVSTRNDAGTAVGASITAGAPTSIEVTRLRLHPIHLEARATVERLDLSLARFGLPPSTPVTVGRGRGSSTVSVVLDARDGLRADARARLEDVALVPLAGGEPVALARVITAEMRDLAVRDGAVRLARLDLDGAVSVPDPTRRGSRRFPLSKMRASVADLAWPISTPGRVRLETSVPGGGSLLLTGRVQPPPARSQLRLRMRGVELAPWTHLLSVAARIRGRAMADLRLDEALAAEVPARIDGSLAVDGLSVADEPASSSVRDGWRRAAWRCTGRPG